MPLFHCVAEMALNADPAIQNRVPLDSETATAPSSSSSEMQATIELMDERHTVALVVNRREELELEVTDEGGKREGEGQRKRVRETANLDLMDHSGSMDSKWRLIGLYNRNSSIQRLSTDPGLYHSKRSRPLYKEGALLCLPLSIGSLRDGSPERVAMEVARCLHEVRTVSIGSHVYSNS